MPTPSQIELWTNGIVRDCLLCCDGDVGAGLAAAELILSTQPIPQGKETKPSVSAFFAYDIHNRHAQGILNRTLKAAKGLTDNARKDLAVALKDSATDSGQAILEFIDKYRLQLAKLLTTTQLASLLEGAREVAAKVPVLEEDAKAIGDTPQPTFPKQEGIHLVTIKEAAKQLGEKNVLTRQDFDALDAAARAKAFAVAGVDAEDTLTKIRDVLVKNVREGADYETFKSQVMEAVDEGTFLSDAHTETVFRTNVQGAFSDGQMVVLQNPLVRSGFPYSAYDSIHDDRVREEHLSLDKHGIDGSNIYRTDDPVFQTFRPPWDYNCRCSWTPITVRQASEAGIKEAKEWLDSGVEPSPPHFVAMPPFEPPPGFQRALIGAPLSIRLSIQPITTFSKISIALGGQPKRTSSNGQWITIGGQHNTETGEKHVGGFHVYVDANGTILKGRLRGKNVKDVKTAFDKKKEKASGGQQGRNVRGAGASPFRRHESVGSPVANSPTGPDNATPRQGRQGKDKPISPEVTGNTPIDRINRRIERYANLFQTKGQSQAAEWLKEFKEQINTLGADQALAALGEAKTNLSAPKNVQYEGAYDELSEVKSEVDFITGYLKRAGINLLQTGSTLDPSSPVISSFSAKNLKALERTVPEAPGNYVPTDQTFENKLEESKHLPGLESSEDIDKVVGSKVTAFTPDVIAKLDAKYGKGKWIVKSYGAEAYAGFGVFFPQKVAQIQRDAKIAIAEAKKGLKQYGFTLFRSEEGKITGVTNGKQVFGFGTEEYRGLNKKVKGLVKQVSQAAPSEAGARLPMSPEQELKEGYFGISLVRNTDGIPIAVSDRDGKTYPFGSPTFKALEETDGGSTGYAIHRAVETDEWRRQGFQADAKFMAQPAFEAVGVKDADRALGLTWETAKEGRVHVTTRGGKASAVPYATLVGRGDDLPAVFASEDSRAMEKAVEDAINQLPESERTGQLYAPDVVKTKDGWKVIELNPSAEGGGSDWLGRNPFVIDALVSQMTGREPMHVQFIRKLLAGKGIKSPKPTPTEGTALAFIEEDHPRKSKGQEGGGQFTKGGSTGAVKTVKLGNIKARYSLHTDTRIKGTSIPLKNYKQQDYHTCGFVAALTLTRYLKSDVTPKEVLRVIRPTMSSGIDGKRMKRSLKELGIDAKFRRDLTIGILRKYVARGTPVLLTIYPEDWSSDHWVIVQGFDGNKIYLTNYKSLPVKVFANQWFDLGEGLVCKPIEKKQGPALSTDPQGHEHKGKGTPDGGQFTGKGKSKTSKKEKTTEQAPPEVIKETKRIAQKKIKNAPVPSAEDIAKANKELELGRQGKGRPGGESRGGSSTDRRKQRENLFNEFGGKERGYICCHGCGRKLHHTPPEGSGFERLERGKIFVKCQGGGYQLPNLLPECFACNRSRNDEQIRKDIPC